jgi:hypothetical protein
LALTLKKEKEKDERKEKTIPNPPYKESSSKLK